MTFITLKHISLDYPIYNVKSQSFKDKMVSLSTGGLIKKAKAQPVIIRALNNISLEIHEGDRIGLVGHNGAGKSTLLKLLAGIYEPTSGQIIKKGRVSTLFDIGLGMNDDATGYENIFLSGLLLGLRYNECQKIVPEVEEFSELGDFLNMPLRTYSAGMRVRLAFSVATAVKPEILLIDEVFGAGDAGFYKKAEEKMVKLIGDARIVVISSHDNKLIERFSNRTIKLEHGSIV